jgi:hypothetical protein
MCIACIKGKSKRLPFPRSKSRATDPLDLIHSDVAIYTDRALDNSRHFIIFLDDHTGMIWIYNISTKAEVYKCWVHLVQYSITHKHKCPKVLRSDNGGPYISNAMTAFNDSKGIHPELSNSHTPQQNGRAESAIRKIKSMMKTLLLHAGLPWNFRCFAALHAVYILNRCPTTIIPNISPLEAWDQKKPNVSHLHTFGCDAFAHVPVKTRPPSAPKAIQ